MCNLHEKLANSQEFQNLLSLQHKLVNLSKEDPSDTLKIIEQYLSNRRTKSPLRSIFTLISYISECRPENYEKSCIILSNFLEEIKNNFSTEEIFHIFQNRNYQQFLLKSNILSIEDISAHYHNNQQIIAFFTQNQEPQINQIIKQNDVSKFQEIISKTNLPLSSRIHFSVTDSNKLNNSSKDPTLLEYAIAYSALDIVKFILMNEEEAELDKKDELYKDIGRYAIFGGNSEIIHLLEQNHMISDISSQRMFYLVDAISYHRNEIVDYLIENYNSNFNFDNFSNCLQWSNFQCFYDHIDSILNDVNQLNIYKQSLLIFAAQYGIIEIVECLLSSYKNLNINNQDIYVYSNLICKVFKIKYL